MGKLAFVFSGQGAQFPGMGEQLCNCSDAAKKVFDQAEQYRNGTIKQCFAGTEQELAQTINTQPCIYTVEMAAAAALNEAGIKPDCVAGFSLGEIAALTYANSFNFKNGFEFIQHRAEYMQREAEKFDTAMYAILKLPAEKVEELAQDFSEVFPVNFNCPGQVVVSGTNEQLEKYVELVSQAGGRAIKLKVGGAFHSPFMNAAANDIAKYLENVNLNETELPVYANSNAEPYSGDYKSLISNQINSPVLWEKIILNMIADGVDTFVEVGVGKTLVGFIKKINADVTVLNVDDEQSFINTVAALR